ncbi:MAG: Nramp family divalent metal transporter [Azoarcus sp.]|nr:Nramp family divalent metal transporter [Azoarcus sp.]
MSDSNQGVLDAGSMPRDGVKAGASGGKTVHIPEIEKLELPDMSPISMFKHFGPGLLLMMTGIGTSHLVTAPVAGGTFSFALLWSVLLAYVMKYYGFQMSFRFTNATGKSVMDAMCTTKGKWAIWYVLFVTIAQCALGQASRVVATAAVLYFFFSEHMGWGLELWHYGVFVGITACALVLSGQYKTLETVTKIFVILLVLTTLFVFFWNPPALSDFRFFIAPHPEFGYYPPGSLLILAAFLGLLPTGLDVALQSSEWGKAKKAGMPMLRKTLEEHGVAGKFDSFNPRAEDLTVHVNKLSPHGQEYCRRWFKIGNMDFAFGHWVSFIIASIFMMLAAMYLYPSDVKGRAVMGELARMFTESIGPGMMYVFILGALAATYSTAINYFDGWPRVVGACCRNLFRKTADLSGIEDPSPQAKKAWYSEHNIYRITIIYSLLASSAIIYGFERPVFLVLIASAMTLLFSPVIFYYMFKFCLNVIPKTDKIYYPGHLVRNFTWFCFVLFTAATLLVIYVKFF